MKTISDIHDVLIEYIENNKVKHNIEYSYTLAALDELLNEIYKEYIEIMNSEDEENENN